MSVIIGSKYVGKAEVRNNKTGEFWSVMPELSPSEFYMQSCLMAPKTKVKNRPVWLFWKH